ELDDLQILNDNRPATIRINMGIVGFELNGSIMHAFRTEQQHRHIDLCPAGEVQLVQDAVVHEGGTLMFQDTGGQSVLGGVGGGQELTQHVQQAVLPCHVEEFIGHVEFQAVGVPGEVGV